MISKAPSNVIYSLAQQGIAIHTLGKAKSHIEMIIHTNQAPKPQASSATKPIPPSAGTKWPTGEEQLNNQPAKQANMNSQTSQTTRDKQTKEGQCFNCNGIGHLSQDCPQKSQSNQQNQQ